MKTIMVSVGLLWLCTAALAQDRSGPQMVMVEGGSFLIGSPDDVGTPAKRTVSVKTFSIGRFEVTQKQWREVMGNNPSTFKGDDKPVHNVSLFDAMEYCNKKSALDKLTPYYRFSRPSNPDPKAPRRVYKSLSEIASVDPSATGYRLPTEAEWEFAAKGGKKGMVLQSGVLATNKAFSGSYVVDEVTVYNRASPAAVGSKAPNELGLHDLSGNVAELCFTLYGELPTWALANPAGNGLGTGIVSKGGGYSAVDRWSLFVGVSWNFPPEASDASVGFRVVKNTP